MVKYLILYAFRKCNDGFPEFGFNIQKNKTAVNFILEEDYDIRNCNIYFWCFYVVINPTYYNLDEEIKVIKSGKPFSWFGHTFCYGLSKKSYDRHGIGMDLMKYENLSSIRDCMTVSDNMATVAFGCEETVIRATKFRLNSICLNLSVIFQQMK